MRRVRKIRKIVKVTSPKDESLNRPSRISKDKSTKKIVKKITQPAVVNRKDIKVKFPTSANHSTVNPIWNGDTVYLIGGGPSLSNFNWSSLNGKKTIAINKAILHYPQADVMYWTDGRVYTWYKDDIDNYEGLKYTIRGGKHYNDSKSKVHVLKRGNKFGLEKAKDTLAHGNNSGYAAINLAVHLGAKKIVLLGYDMGSNGKLSHFHNGYPVNPTAAKIYNDQFIPAFEYLKSELDVIGVKVFNACPTSKLNTFPKISIEEALSFR